jgi:hypothetical protein
MRFSDPVMNLFPGKANRSDVAVYAAVIGMAALLALFPLAFGVLVGAVILVVSAFAYRRFARLEFWQVLALIVLAAYLVINYGFANLTVHVGVPVIVGHTLMFTALGLALFKSRGRLLNVLSDPAAVCLLAMLPLAVLHLIVDVPRYGAYAIRDSSMFLETVFILLGLYWATREEDTRPLLKWLFVTFLLNLAYGFTYPWADTIQSWSPVSGIFLKIPLFGNYWGTALVYLIGALFVICLGTYVVKWPRWVLFLLAGAQIFGLAIQQHRAMYLGVGLSLLVFLLMGEFKKFAKLATLVGSGLIIVLLLTSVANVTIQGRMGPVDETFLEEHMLSLLGRRNTPAIGSIYDREDWYEQTKRRIESHRLPALLVGEGFGFPLIDFVNPQGVEVRQPHNSNLTVLLRIGLLGLGFWIAFNLIILARFFRAFRNRRRLDPLSRNLNLWLFFWYMLCFLEWSVQPGLEFSAGAITFYFLIGFALGSMQRQMPEQPVKWLARANWQGEGFEGEEVILQQAAE